MVSAMLIVSQVIIAVIMVFVSALLLMASARIFKLKDKSYLTALKVSAILYAINLIFGIIGVLSFAVAAVMWVLSFLVLILLGIYLIKTFYKLDWGKAVLTWLVWFILSMIVGAIISAIVSVIFVSTATVTL